MPLTRRFLLGLHEDPCVFSKKLAIDTAVRDIYQKCCTEAAQGKTKYTISTNYIPQIHAWAIPGLSIPDQAAIYKKDLMKALKEVFPDSNIRYHETVGYEGRIIESLIAIDWSN